MKTLKILAILCIILVSSSTIGNSQPVRTELPGRIGLPLPCVNETLIGDIIVERVVWYNLKEGSLHLSSKLQLKYDHVVLYGSKSHLEYTLNFVSQSGWAGEGNEGESADVNHFVRMAMVRLDGKLIALLPILVQKVQTPDDEIIVNINDFDVRCF
jgi:hypothetical protein